MRRHLTNQRGFTLTELLVSAAIIGVVMAGVFVLQRGGQQAYLFGSNRVETQQNARVALELMTRELRSAAAVTAIPGPTSITFQSKDDATPPVSHTIQYSLSGGTLSRVYDGNSTPLIAGVDALQMTYCKVFNTATATCTQAAAAAADVNVIRIRLKTKTEETVASGSAGDVRTRMESDVMLRSSM